MKTAILFPAAAYQELGLQRNASKSEVKRAHAKLQVHHPDNHAGESAVRIEALTNKISRINNARDMVLEYLGGGTYVRAEWRVEEENSAKEDFVARHRTKAKKDEETISKAMAGAKKKEAPGAKIKAERGREAGGDGSGCEEKKMRRAEYSRRREKLIKESKDLLGVLLKLMTGKYGTGLDSIATAKETENLLSTNRRVKIIRDELDELDRDEALRADETFSSHRLAKPTGSFSEPDMAPGSPVSPASSAPASKPAVFAGTGESDLAPSPAPPSSARSRPVQQVFRHSFGEGQSVNSGSSQHANPAEHVLASPPSSSKRPVWSSSRSQAENAGPLSSTPKMKKRKMCRYFSSTGRCRYGNRCRFMHTKPSFPAQTTEGAEEAKEPSTESTSSCLQTSTPETPVATDLQTNTHETPVVTEPAVSDPSSDEEAQARNSDKEMASEAKAKAEPYFLARTAAQETCTSEASGTSKMKVNESGSAPIDDDIALDAMNEKVKIAQTDFIEHYQKFCYESIGMARILFSLVVSLYVFLISLAALVYWRLNAAVSRFQVTGVSVQGLNIQGRDLEETFRCVHDSCSLMSEFAISYAVLACLFGIVELILPL